MNALLHICRRSAFDGELEINSILQIIVSASCRYVPGERIIG